MRFLQIRASRIGEVGASIGYFVEAGALNWRPRLRGVFLTFPDQRRIANSCYLNYWRRYVRVVTHPLLYRFAFRISQKPEMEYASRWVKLPDGEEVMVDRALVAAHALWEKQHRAPLFQLDPVHARRGWETLRRLGLGRDDWFVAVHAREAAYFGEDANSPERHRNARISSYIPAMRTIVERGGWVVRVGDPTMERLPPLDRVIDYPHTTAHSDWMDVYLGAACRFFLGCSSGLFAVAWSFGRPCALANWNSLVTRPWSRRDLYIPKLWWIEDQNRFLSFGEALAQEYAERADADELERVGLRLVDSSPGEIVQLVDEMFAREGGLLTFSDEDELQLRLDALLTHYRLGTGARMGSAFLRRHAELLTDFHGAVDGQI